MSILNSALHEALLKRFPTVTASPAARFLPMLDLSKGEVSSTAAIEVARVLRGDARAIAQDLICDISKRVSGSWKVVAGYMVLSETPNEILQEESLLRSEVFSSSDGSGAVRTIICLVPDATSPVYARLRLIACSALQALLSVAFEGRCRLGFAPEATSVVTTQEEVLELVSSAVLRCFAHEGEKRVVEALPSELNGTDEPFTLWTSHHYHDRLSREIKQTFVDIRDKGHGFLKIPGDGWLLSRERALSEILSAGSLERVVRRLSTKEAWLRWVHHLASSVPSGDLDPSVALYDECASPRWSLQALHQRVSHLVTPHLPQGESLLREAVVKSPLSERAMMIRALFLPVLTARAIREGEVLAWSTVVEEFSALSHALLNAPHYRAILRSGVFSDSVLQINAGLALGLAGILAAVTEG